MPLPGRNGFADRVCDNCDNSCHKASEDGSAEGRRWAPLGRLCTYWSTLPYCAPAGTRNQERLRAAFWIASR